MRYLDSQQRRADFKSDFIRLTYRVFCAAIAAIHTADERESSRISSFMNCTLRRTFRYFAQGFTPRHLRRFARIWGFACPFTLALDSQAETSTGDDVPDQKGTEQAPGEIIQLAIENILMLFKLLF